MRKEWRWLVLGISFVFALLFFKGSVIDYLTPTDQWRSCISVLNCSETIACGNAPINTHSEFRAKFYDFLPVKLGERQCWNRKYDENRELKCENKLCTYYEWPSPISGKTKWFKCNKNEDCTTIKDNCGYSAGVNIHFKNLAEKERIIRNHCQSECLKEISVQVQCVRGYCESKSHCPKEYKRITTLE